MILKRDHRLFFLTRSNVALRTVCKVSLGGSVLALTTRLNQKVRELQTFVSRSQTLKTIIIEWQDHPADFNLPLTKET